MLPCFQPLPIPLSRFAIFHRWWKPVTERVHADQRNANLSADRLVAIIGLLSRGSKPSAEISHPGCGNFPWDRGRPARIMRLCGRLQNGFGWCLRAALPPLPEKLSHPQPRTLAWPVPRVAREKKAAGPLVRPRRRISVADKFFRKCKWRRRQSRSDSACRWSAPRGPPNLHESQAGCKNSSQDCCWERE